MKEIEEKEKQLEQMETEFVTNAREEIRLEEMRLSKEKQAKVDNRKQELEAMLASMQEMEKEFDELDAGFDAQLANILSPDLALMDTNQTKEEQKWSIQSRRDTILIETNSNEKFRYVVNMNERMIQKMSIKSSKKFRKRLSGIVCSESL